jgi:hypothetical protein
MRDVLIIIAVLLLLWNVVLARQHPNAKVKSSVDGTYYSVKSEFSNGGEAADVLARLNRINMRIISHMEEKYQGTDRAADVKFLAGNYSGDVLAEHIPRTTVNTSYVLNKGDEIKLCLRDPQTGQLHDFDTLLFVNLHELSHLFDREYGHEKSFWRGFAFLLREAHSIGVYTPIDYGVHPVNYCGIKITANPFFSH